jgi:hypothetical protein
MKINEEKTLIKMINVFIRELRLKIFPRTRGHVIA